MNKEKLQEQIKTFWNEFPCGTDITKKEQYTKEYFDEIETFRYAIEPEIFSFAQFTQFHNKKVLEVGTGAGTDFLQWVRAGAQVYGIDVTEKSIEHVEKRLGIYNLEAQEIIVADAQNIPYQEDFFDCVYSWGVIHHTPDMQKCLKEIVRVTKPGGTIKIMIYNRRSLYAFYQYVRYGLFKLRPFRALKEILFHHQESKGTQAFTFKEVKKMLAPLPVQIKKMKAPATSHDLLYYKSTLAQWCARFFACILGWRNIGWFMMIELQKNK